MMKKVTISLFVFSLLNATLTAQSFQFSAPVKTKATSEEVKIIGKDSQGFYSIEDYPKEQRISISRYTIGKMQQEWSKPISYAGGNQDSHFQEMLFLNNGFYLFSRSFHKESEQLRIYCTLVNSNGDVQHENILLHHVLSEGLTEAPSFGVTTSPDEQSFLIYFNPPLERKLTEALSFRCYDIDLEILWEKEILLPYGSNIIQVQQFNIDNLTNLYMLSGKKQPGGFDKINKPDAGRHVLFFYNPKEHKLKEYDVTLKEKQISSIIMKFDSHQNVILGGYYSLDYKMNISGTYFYNITSKGGPVLAASFMPFNEELTARYQSQNSNNALPNYHLIDIVTVENGNALLIGEQRFLTEEIMHHHLSNTSTIETRANFGDIIITKVEANGRHSWSKYVPKYQYSTTGIAAYSFDYFRNDKGLSIFFNDNKGNLEKLKSTSDNTVSPWAGNLNSITTKVAIDIDGNVSAEALMTNKDNTALLIPQASSTNHKSPIILSYSTGDVYKFCKVN